MDEFERLPVDIDTFVFDDDQISAVKKILQGGVAQSSFTINGIRYTIEKTSGGFTVVNAWSGPITKAGRITFYSNFHDTVEVTGQKRLGIGTTLIQTKIAVDGLLPFETSNRFDKLALLTKFGYFPIAKEVSFKSLHKNTLPLEDIAQLISSDVSSDPTSLESGPYRLQYNPTMAQKFAELMKISFDSQKVPQLKK